jgi:pathogenesis-related protein 1
MVNLSTLKVVVSMIREYTSGVRPLAACLLLTALASAAGETPLARDFLAAHNAARAKVGAPKLVWSDRLAAIAQEWADHLASVGGFEHRPKSKYGENLFEMRGGKSTAAEVVEKWMSEAANFDYKSNRCRKGAMCGHYTQVVWRNTKEVGCAVAGKGTREVWVCDYDPPGNYVGRRPY